MSEIDIELFIDEIKKYPEIWNTSTEEYHDKNKKQAAWNSVCEATYENYNEKLKLEKDNILKKSMSKWKNLKDNYGKSIRKRRKSGQSATVPGRQYIYARQLSFLQHSTTQSTRENETSGRDPLDSADETEEHFQKETSARSTAVSPNSASMSVCENPTWSKRRRARRRGEFKSALLKFLNTPFSPEPDQDRSFFESLLPIVRKLDEDRKLQFRSEVVNLLQRIRHGCVAHSAASTLLPAQHNSQFHQPLPAQHNFLVQQAAPSSFHPRNVYPASYGVDSGSLNIPFPYSPTGSHSTHASTTVSSSSLSSGILLSSEDST